MKFIFQLLCYCIIALTLILVSPAIGFNVDNSAQPPTHPPLSPADGGEAILNPPAFVW